MSTIKKLAGETVIYGISSILPRLLNWLLAFVYLTNRLNNTSDYGTYTELYTFSAILLTIMVFRLDTAFFRFGANKKNRDIIFGSSFILLFIISTLIAGSIFLFSPMIAEALNYKNQVYYVRWFSGILWFEALTALIFSRFRLEGRPLRFMMYKVANILVMIAAIIFFLEILPRVNPETYSSISNYLGIQHEIDYVFFANLISSGFVFLILIPESLKYKLKLDLSVYKKLLWYAAPLVLVGIAAVLNQNGASVFLPRFLPYDYDTNKAISGVFMASVKYALIINLATVAFNYAAEPFFFNQHEKNPNDKTVFGDVAKAYTLCMAIIVLAMYLFQDLLILIMGESFRTESNIIPLLLLGFFFLGLYYNFSIWYKLSGKTMYGAIISSIALFITIGLSITLIPIIGIWAAAIANFTCYFVMAYLGYSMGQKHYPISYPTKDINLIIILMVFCLSLSLVVRLISESLYFLLPVNTIILVVFIWIIWYKNSTFIRTKVLAK